MAVRKAETFAPVTLAHIRSHGCRDLLVYCDSGRCHRSALMNANWLPDETPVRSLCPRMVCTRCGMIGTAFDRHFGMQARMTLTATPGRCGRKAARLSDSNVKVPPGVMA
jgi:hypothetical protein